MKKLITICKYDLKFNYYVTDDGKVWSERSKKFLNPQLDKNGYEKVQMISKDNKRHRYSVHRLIMENFYPIKHMEAYQVNHKDGNKRNNCLQNLEWVTCKENIFHAVQNGLRASINGAAKLTTEQVIDIYLRANNGETNVDLGKEFNVHPDTIGKIKNKKTWKQLLNNINKGSTTISKESRVEAIATRSGKENDIV